MSQLMDESLRECLRIFPQTFREDRATMLLGQWRQDVSSRVSSSRQLQRVNALGQSEKKVAKLNRNLCGVFEISLFYNACMISCSESMISEKRNPFPQVIQTFSSFTFLSSILADIQKAVKPNFSYSSTGVHLADKNLSKIRIASCRVSTSNEHLVWIRTSQFTTRFLASSSWLSVSTPESYSTKDSRILNLYSFQIPGRGFSAIEIFYWMVFVCVVHSSSLFLLLRLRSSLCLFWISRPKHRFGGTSSSRHSSLPIRVSSGFSRAGSLSSRTFMQEQRTNDQSKCHNICYHQQISSNRRINNKK